MEEEKGNKFQKSASPVGLALSCQLPAKAALHFCWHRKQSRAEQSRAEQSRAAPTRGNAAMVVTRFAPSPTGELHLGGLRTVLFNVLAALSAPRNSGSKFLIRIEDTDTARTVAGAADRLLGTLARCGIRPSAPPETQSSRLPLYRAHAETLYAQGDAYPCFCSRDRLAVLRGDGYDGTCRDLDRDEARQRIAGGQPHVFRMRVPRASQRRVVVQDGLRGAITFPTASIEDQVILKQDGFPTYHLASVVDDRHMGVTHVVRGEEWLPSAPKHVLLYEFFGWDMPQFYHLPLLTHANGKKLSKRDGRAFIVESLLEEGYLPSALVNFVALLGWRPPHGDTQELFLSPLDEIPLKFSLADLNATSAVVDLKRLNSLNAAHMRHKVRSRDEQFLHECVLPRLHQVISSETTASTDRRVIWDALELAADRASTVHDLVAACRPFLSLDAQVFDLESVLAQYNTPEERAYGARVLRTAMDHICCGSPGPSAADIDNLVVAVGGAKGKSLPVIRCALTGIPMGAAVDEIVRLLGQERTRRRLEALHEVLVNT